MGIKTPGPLNSVLEVFFLSIMLSCPPTPFCRHSNVMLGSLQYLPSSFLGPSLSLNLTHHGRSHFWSHAISAVTPILHEFPLWHSYKHKFLCLILNTHPHWLPPFLPHSPPTHSSVPAGPLFSVYNEQQLCPLMWMCLSVPTAGLCYIYYSIVWFGIVYHIMYMYYYYISFLSFLFIHL